MRGYIEVPKELTFGLPALDEALMQRLRLIIQSTSLGVPEEPITPDEAFYANVADKVDQEFAVFFREYYARSIKRMCGEDWAAEDTKGSQLYAAGIMSAWWRVFSKFDLFVVPFFSSRIAFDLGVPEGSSIAFQATLSQIPEVAEEALSWDQILEFRKDPESVRKYRAFKIWLQSSVNARTVSEAEEIIAQKLEDYEWAIKKHGLNTITGAMTTVLSSDTLVSVAAGTGIAALLDKPVWAIIASGLIAGTKIGVWLTERRIDLTDVKRGPNSEVALIYDAKQLISASSSSGS
jgi:hypothetical protein